MNIRNNLRRVVTIAVTAAAIGVGATGVASASTAKPAAVTSVSHQVASETAAQPQKPQFCWYGWGWSPYDGWHLGWHWVWSPYTGWYQDWGWYDGWGPGPGTGLHCQ